MPIKLLLIALLLFGACGKKTALIVYDDSAPEPVLESVASSVSANVLSLSLDMSGGGGAVSYQIDRAEVDPSCQCINNWLRFYESSASSQRSGLKRRVKLSYPDKIYAFRVRVVDSLGRKSAWSKVIKAKAK